VRLLVDTNILLHAANAGSPFHPAARRYLQEQARARSPWCTTWPILYEFLRVSTHRKVFPSPLKPKQALEFVRSLTAREELAILTPTGRHFEVLAAVVDQLSQPCGNLFHDIHTAVLMREHGVPEIVTADADFLQFDFLKVINPLK
jgi:toxin-antitoxin system PIN domain toxin